MDTTDTKNISKTGEQEKNMVPLADQVKEHGRDLLHDTQEKAGDLMNQVQTHLKTKLTDEKNAVSTSLEHVATAVHQAATGLREKDQEVLGSYADSTGRLVNNLSSYLQKADIEDFVKDMETEARKRPALFIGGFFVLGLLAGRFLKSSSRAHSTTNVTPRTLAPMRKTDDPFSNAAAI